MIKMLVSKLEPVLAMMETESAHQNGEVKNEMEVQPLEHIKTENEESLPFQPQQLELKQETVESSPQQVRNESDRTLAKEIESKKSIWKFHL
jgi:hemerythrin-like domain-containing protein